MLGLNKDPSHFPAIPPIIAETRRRVWWHLFFIDISVSIAAGLPPWIENAYWDVRTISEVKDHLIGTAPAIEYEKGLASDDRQPLSVDQPDDVDQNALVSTSGTFATGKYQDAGKYTNLDYKCADAVSVTSKHLLTKLFEQRPMTRSDVAQIRLELEKLKTKLLERIRRIPRSIAGLDTEEPPTMATYSGNAALNKWARLVLSGLCDKNWCFFYHPVVHSAISRIWAQLRPRSMEHFLTHSLQEVNH